MKVVIIIEDKKEELLFAIAAVKKELGVEGKEGMGITVDDIFLDEKPWMHGFEYVGHTIVYANDLHGAEAALAFARREPQRLDKELELFILTDLMFPLNTGQQEQANGISVILDAVVAGIPVTVCSDTDHHQVKFLPKLYRELERAHPGARINLVLDKKDWTKAVQLLLSSKPT